MTGLDNFAGLGHGVCSSTQGHVSIGLVARASALPNKGPKMIQNQLPGIDRPKRKSPRVMAKLVDAGSSPSNDSKTIARFECKKCGWDSGWQDDDRPDSQIFRGTPCAVCNS